MIATDHYSTTAYAYAHDIVDGEIPACGYVRIAAQRFLDDLERPDLIYDGADVESCGSFLESLTQVSGRWRGQRLVLSPYQCFAVANMYGLKKTDDPAECWRCHGTGQDGDGETCSNCRGKGEVFLRKYAEAYIEVPRKNGKSFWQSGLSLFMLCMDGELGAEVYCAASTEDQAHKVFGPARQMLLEDPDLQAFLGVDFNKRAIYSDSENLRFKPVIGDPPDGDSPSFAVVDEYHEHAHDRALKTFQTGMGARLQPLLVVITTAGQKIGGPCHVKRDEAIDVLQGSIRDEHSDSLFALIYTIDETADEDFWKTEDALLMANPNIGHSVSLAFLKREQAQAIRTRHAQSEFKTKHLNIWIGQNDPWIDINKWNRYAYDMEFEDFLDLPCIVATDLSAKNDFTAALVLFYEDVAKEDLEQDLAGEPVEEPEPDYGEVPEDEDEEPAESPPEGEPDDGDTRRVYWAFPFFWLPKATFEKTPRYQAWGDHIELFEGEEIDIIGIADWLKDLLKNELRAIEYVTDPYRSIGVEQHIADSLVWTEIVRHPNAIGAYSGPMYEIQAAVEAGRFRHPGNPVLNWMVGNLTYRREQRTNDVAPIRNKDDSKKIDGAVCAVMATGRAMAQAKDEPFKIVTVKMG